MRSVRQRAPQRRPHRRGLGRRLRAACSDGRGRRAGDVLDIGGGTGGFAVRVAELGHRVTVVDPSPDALAALDRRAAESGVADRSPASRATWPTCSTLRRARQRRPGALPRRARGRRRPRRRAGHDRRGAAPRRRAQPAGRPAARRRGRPGDGRPLRRRPWRCSTTPDQPTGRPAPGRRFTPTSSPPARRRRLRGRPRSTASGSSPTWSPAPCSTSSPAPPPPWSSWSARSPTGPSTSPSPPSCTSLATQVADPPAERRLGVTPPTAPAGRSPDCPILHVDMDAFYASVAIRDRPEPRTTCR